MSKNPRKTILPVYRIKTIMKTTPDVGPVSSDAYFLMTKATEYFITYLTEEAYRNNDEKDSLEYKDVANVVQCEEAFEFLRDLIPKKITVREFREIMEKKPRSTEEDLAFYLNSGDKKRKES